MPRRSTWCDCGNWPRRPERSKRSGPQRGKVASESEEIRPPAEDTTKKIREPIAFNDEAEFFRSLLERMNKWDHLDKLAQESPAEFATLLWPIARELFTALPDRAETYRVRYSSTNSWRTRIDRAEYSSVDSRDWFLVALDAVLAIFARNSPDQYLELVRTSEETESVVIHRLLSRAYRSLAAVRPTDALAYLLADPRRFWLGGSHDGLSDSINLVTAIGEHATDAEVTRLVEAIHGLVFYPDLGLPITNDDPESKYTRGHRFRLLSALPIHRLSSFVLEELDRERALLPKYATVPDGISIGEMKFIGSPVSSEEMAAMLDDDIAARIEELPDSTEWHNPKDRMLGGSVQLSREFEKFVASNADRGLALLPRLQPGVHEMYAAAAIKGLVAAERLVTEVFGVVADFDRRGFHSHDFRTEVSWAAASLARGRAPRRLLRTTRSMACG